MVDYNSLLRERRSISRKASHSIVQDQVRNANRIVHPQNLQCRYSYPILPLRQHLRLNRARQCPTDLVAYCGTLMVTSKL